MEPHMLIEKNKLHPTHVVHTHELHDICDIQT